MKRNAICILIAFSILAIFIYPKEPLAVPYYEGKVIKIIIGWEPGGGYDRLARLLAKHLPKYIPGKPSVIVENMTGAGSIIAANYVYNIAKPDGLTIVSFSRGLYFAQLTKVEGVRFDITKYSWIGSAAVESTILALRTDLSYNTFDDLRRSKESIPLAGVGPGSTDVQYAILLKEFLGLNLKVVIYPSSAAGMLAIERKEVDGKAGSYSSLKPYIERGLVHPLIRGRVSEPGIENLPVDEDLLNDNKRKTIMAMRSAGDKIGRPYVAPPGTPTDVVNILRDAFAKVTRDTELKEESKKFMMTFEYVPADECSKVLNEVLNQPEDIVKEFSKYIKF